MSVRRWTAHALDNLAEREIEREEAERTIDVPEVTRAGRGNRTLIEVRDEDSL